jgi:hypothetical protein
MSEVKDVSKDVEMTEAATAPVAAEASNSAEKQPEIKTEKVPAKFEEPLPTVADKTPEEVQSLLSAAAKQSKWSTRARISPG